MPQNTGVNKVILMGTIFTQPRCHRYGDLKEEYAFTLVTSEFIEKKDGPAEHLEYHNIIMPGKVILKDFELKKGRMVYIEGKVQTTSWIDADRVRRYKTEILAQQVRLVNSTEVKNAINAAVI